MKQTLKFLFKPKESLFNIGMVVFHSFCRSMFGILQYCITFTIIFKNPIVIMRDHVKRVITQTNVKCLSYLLPCLCLLISSPFINPNSFIWVTSDKYVWSHQTSMFSQNIILLLEIKAVELKTCL